MVIFFIAAAQTKINLKIEKINRKLVIEYGQLSMP